MTIVRWVAGSEFTLSIHAAPAPTPAPEVLVPAPLPDVVPEFLRSDDELRATFFHLPEFVPDEVTPVQSIRTYFVPPGTPVADSPGAYHDAGLVFTETDVSGSNNVEVEVPYPANGVLPDGDYIGRPFFGYAS